MKEKTNELTEGKFLPLENCPKFNSCEAPVCPLWEHLEGTINIGGNEPYCVYMLDYCEGKKTPIDYELKATEKIWRKILEKHLDRKLKDRVRIRKHFAKKTPSAYSVEND